MKHPCTKSMQLLLLIIVAILYSQTALSQISVTGTVVDNKGEPLIGVNILLVGTNQGTVTNIDGVFQMTLPNSRSVLKFSFIGYVTQEIIVGSQQKIAVTLLEESVKMDEVIVLGYGSTKKSDLTGAIAKVDAKDIKDIPVRSATDALQGKIAGLQVTSSSGSPGSLPSIQIRGISSITNTEPFYVVDGFPQGDIAWLSDNDIESIQVLKDASACAIYGSRATNGIIMVTTKKGKANSDHQMSVNLNTSYGIQQITKKYDMMDAGEFIDYRNLANANGDGSVWMSSTEKAQVLSFLKENFKTSAGTNWQDQIFKDAVTQNYNLSVTNGSSIGNYYTSLSYMNQDGVVKGADFRRISWNNNLTSQLTKFAKLTTFISVVDQSRHNIDESNINSGTIFSALAADPVSPVYRTNLTDVPSFIYDLFSFDYIDPTNPYNNYSPILFNNKVNPVAETDIMHQSVWKDLTLRANVSADIDVTKWLKFKTTVNGSLYRANPEYFVPKYYIGAYQNESEGYVGAASYSSNYFVYDNVITLDKNYDFLGKQHTTLMIGSSFEETHSSSFGAYKYGLVTNDESQRVIDAATSYNSVGGSKGEAYLLSYFGRLSHSWDNKYLFTGSIRYDGSSHFTDAHKWAFFPSMSLGYVFTEESFMKSLSFIDFGKLRLTWGESGNQAIDEGLYLSTYSLNGGYYLFGSGSDQLNQLSGGRSYIGNQELKWETTKQVDVGLDLTLFNNKLSLTMDYFNKKTRDLLLSVPLPAFMGYPDDPYQNAGEILNEGLELSLNFKSSAGKFHYEIGGNLFTLRNKVISLGDGIPISGGYYSPNFYDFTKTEKGKPIGHFYGYKSNGIFQSQTDIDNYKNSKGLIVTQEGAQPGDLKFVDVNNDQTVDGNDLTDIGNPFPKISYGFNFNCDYHGFDMVMAFNGVHGNKIMNIMRLDFYSGTSYYNAPKDLMTKAWTEENHSNSQFKISTDNTRNLRVSDWLVEDGSYLRLKTLQFGYSLPAKLANSLKLKSCRIWVGGTNLLTITKYSGMSPEMGNSDPKENGIDIAFYPQAREYLMGLNVQF